MDSQFFGLVFYSILSEKRFPSKIYIFNGFTVFVDASLKSNSPYFLLNKKINFSKNKTESKVENLTQTYVKNVTSAHIRIAN